jgi:hypothetical protein
MNKEPLSAGDGQSLGVLPTIARLALLAGAATCVVLMLRTPQHVSRIIVLAVLFTGWTLLPFAALALADLRSASWSMKARVFLYQLMLIVSVASVAAYAFIATHLPAAQPAFPFLVLPVASWLVMVMAAVTIRLLRA